MQTTNQGTSFPAAPAAFPVAQESSTAASSPSQTSDRTTEPGLRRVMHIINGEHFSGAERVQQLLGKRLGQFGYDPQFACVKPGKFAECCQLRKYQVLEAPMQGRLDLQVVQKLAQLVRAGGSQLLHAHTPRTALVTSLVARQTGLPWVYHVHSPTSRDSTRGLVNRVNAWIESYSIRKCDLLMTVSKSLRREMLRQGVSRRKLAVVANGVPALDPIDSQSRQSLSRWRIGMIALMRPRKGVEVALQAMQRIHRQGLPITLELIGGFETEAYQAQIMQSIQDLGLTEVVQWTGFTNDIPLALQRLDGLLLPSLFGEGMPMVVLEAISAAIPVVATRVEGTPEVIRDGVEGYLAEPRCPDSLAAKIAALAADRQRWMQLSQQALQRHRAGFSDWAMAGKVARAYDRVLSGQTR